MTAERILKFVSYCSNLEMYPGKHLAKITSIYQVIQPFWIDLMSAASISSSQPVSAEPNTCPDISPDSGISQTHSYSLYPTGTHI